jgi:predicted NAD/FAD-dependent oxidoreductase
MNVLTEKTVIVGAGLSGLYLGQLLSARGENPLILEKSKGLGGRVATRRIDEMGLDHGALFLDHHEYFSSLHMISTPSGDYLKGGMNALAKSMAKDLKIMREQRLAKILPVESGLELETEEGLKIFCKNLILSAPIPQSVEVLDKNNLLPKSHGLRSILYTKSIMLLATLKGELSGFRSFTYEDHDFQFMHERGLHPQGLGLRLTPSLAELLFERPDTEILAELINIYRRSPISPIEIEKFELKKWRYSRPLSLYADPFAKLSESLYLCGDGFAHPLKSAHALSLVL